MFLFFPSTNGEGSLIFNGAYRSPDSRLPLPEIKISWSFLRFEGYRWVDLLEIYPFDPSNSLAFDFRQSTFAHSRSKNTAGAPALGTWNWATLENLCVYPQDNGERTGKNRHHNPRTSPGFPHEDSIFFKRASSRFSLSVGQPRGKELLGEAGSGGDTG